MMVEALLVNPKSEKLNPKLVEVGFGRQRGDLVPAFSVDVCFKLGEGFFRLERESAEDLRGDWCLDVVS